MCSRLGKWVFCLVLLLLVTAASAAVAVADGMDLLQQQQHRHHPHHHKNNNNDHNEDDNNNDNRGTNSRSVRVSYMSSQQPSVYLSHIPMERSAPKAVCFLSDSVLLLASSGLLFRLVTHGSSAGKMWALERDNMRFSAIYQHPTARDTVILFSSRRTLLDAEFNLLGQLSGDIRRFEFHPALPFYASFETAKGVAYLLDTEQRRIVHMGAPKDVGRHFGSTGGQWHSKHSEWAMLAADKFIHVNGWTNRNYEFDDCRFVADVILCVAVSTTQFNAHDGHGGPMRESHAAVDTLMYISLDFGRQFVVIEDAVNLGSRLLMSLILGGHYVILDECLFFDPIAQSYAGCMQPFYSSLFALRAIDEEKRVWTLSHPPEGIFISHHYGLSFAKMGDVANSPSSSLQHFGFLPLLLLNPPYLLRSSDFGVTFENVTAKSSFRYVTSMSSTVLFAIGDRLVSLPESEDLLMYSLDSSMSWEAVNVPDVVDSENEYAMQTAFTDGSHRAIVFMLEKKSPVFSTLYVEFSLSLSKCKYFHSQRLSMSGKHADVECLLGRRLNSTAALFVANACALPSLPFSSWQEDHCDCSVAADCQSQFQSMLPLVGEGGSGNASFLNKTTPPAWCGTDMYYPVSGCYFVPFDSCISHDQFLLRYQKCPATVSDYLFDDQDVESSYGPWKILSLICFIVFVIAVIFSGTIVLYRKSMDFQHLFKSFRNLLFRRKPTYTIIAEDDMHDGAGILL
eukprot:ANDGO_04376.mRNA.1 hypothetical protein